MRRRLTLVGLSCLLGAGVLVGASVAFADTVVDTMQVVDATAWVPDAPGLSGVAYRPGNNSLIVVDMQNHDFAGFDGTNLWEYDLDTGAVAYTGSIPLSDPNDDPTGVAFDSTTGTLFVSSDSTMSVWIIQAGPDAKFGTGDDIDLGEIPLFGDVEDPAFHANGHLYVLEGGGLITDINPVDAIFDNGNDLQSSFAIPEDLDGNQLQDVEALAYDPASGNLVAGAKNDQVIYEFTTAGVFVQEHNTSGTAIQSLSGLTAQPAEGAIPVTYWVAERGTDSTTVSDGALYRISFGPAPVLPPSPPVLTGVPASPLNVNEKTLVTFDAGATDPNIGDTLTFSLTGQPTGATINSTSGLFTWTPTEAQGPGTYNLTVTVSDGALTDSEPLQIIVAETNSPPVVTNPGSLLHGEGEVLDVTMFGIDPDIPAQTKTWSATGLPPGLSISPSTGHITGTVSAGATTGSPYTAKVRLTDNGAGSLFDEETFSWAITNTNLHAPVLGAIGNKNIAQGGSLTFKATATDADGDGVAFSLVSPPSGATITSNGNFSWAPSQAPGNYNVTIKVSDNGSPVRSDSQTFAVTVLAPDPGDINPFVDDDGHIFENAIEWLDSQGITSGCNPPVNDRFCPNDFVTRGQMAAFLVRALHYTTIGADYFIDDNGHIFENAINRLRTAGVTQGCNPPANNRYCPNALVTRGQMAAFLVRAFGYTAGGSTNYFIDDNGSVFETAINRLRTAGVTQGCNPPANDRFCPNDLVTRGQMAAFLKRALGG